MIDSKVIRLLKYEYRRMLPFGYRKPMLGYVLVGNNPDSELYVKLKKQACDSIGISYEGFHFPESIT